MIPIGEQFTTYGFASDGTVIRCYAQRRLKVGGGMGSRKVRERRLRLTFPDTSKGFKAAGEWSFATNLRSNERFMPAPQVTR